MVFNKVVNVFKTLFNTYQKEYKDVTMNDEQFVKEMEEARDKIEIANRMYLNNLHNQLDVSM